MTRFRFTMIFFDSTERLEYDRECIFFNLQTGLRIPSLSRLWISNFMRNSSQLRLVIHSKSLHQIISSGQSTY